ncbi:hypothetical protein VNI00_012931 [Paramarasmius palmivorus]|uniref:Zn(2)-C6 fungal-type domain-containing protein n=1 Tax=Paramarasmius palmivorus TaxID=297713 RepID=A0AAW0C3M0_9AGAR
MRTACGNCRKRKIKCDGLRPVCTQCLTRSTLEDVCDYGDYGGLTTAEELERNIQRLEARIRELEHAEAPDAVRLRQYAGPSEMPQRRDSSRGTPIVSDESPLELRSSLLQSFLPQHAAAFGFFLNQPRFAQSTLSVHSAHPSRPCRGLLNTLYFVASALNYASNPSSQLLIEAVGILSTDHPNKILHAIQAEILLATWFFHSNRVLEGKYHLGTAVSLTVGAGLHRIRSPDPNRSSIHTMALPTPADSIEEGERIIAFWQVYAMSNIWDAISGPASTCVIFNGDGKSIDTPWAWDMHDYEELGIPPNLTGGLTVHKFLMRSPDSVNTGLSTTSLFAKASLLFSKAKLFAESVFRTGPMQPPSAQAVAYFQSLNALIDHFTSTLAPISPETVMSPALFSQITLAHTLAYASSIHLHSPFAATDARSSTKMLSAAELAVGLLPHLDSLLANSENFPVINPIFGALWLLIGKVFVDELRRLRSLRRLSSGTRSNTIFGMLEGLKRTMEMAGRSSPFIADQFRQLTEAQ